MVFFFFPFSFVIRLGIGITYQPERFWILFYFSFNYVNYIFLAYIVIQWPLAISIIVESYAKNYKG